MSNFKELLVLQKTEIDELQRLIRNYKADGPSRKTKKYLEDKQKTFSELFRVIKQHHNEMVKNKPIEDHEYFKNHIFEDLEALYSSVMENVEILLKKQREIQPKPFIFPQTSTMTQATTPTEANQVDESQTKKNTYETITINDNDEQNDNSVPTENENDNNGSELNNTFDNSLNLNLTNITGGTSMLTLQYEEIMDMLTAARDLNNASSHGMVRAHLDNLKTTWNEFRATFQKARSEGLELDFSYTLLLQRYMTTMGKLNECLTSSKTIANESSNIQFALPKIKLPEFSGKPSEWRGFISLFDRMVHNNNNMDHGLKIEFLKTRIKGEAAKIISHIDPTPENYSTCYTLIRKRYDNKREAMGIWIENILNLPKINKENYDALKTMHDTVYESIMSIKNVGVSVENWDPLLCHILTKKLNQTTLIHYECQLNNVREVQSLSSFLSYLENRFMALQSAGAKDDSQFQNSPIQYKKSEKPFNKSVKCLICDQEHLTIKCPILLKKEIRERIELAKSKRICLNCLSGMHKTHDCKSKFSCKTCKKHHHSMLHMEAKSNNDRTIKTNVAQVQEDSEPIIIHANVALQKTVSVLLATAMIGVRDKYGSIIMLRALLDQGSQSAFITEQAAQTLKIHRESINAIVSGIGDKTQAAKQAIEITVFPRFESDFIITTRAIILPKLTQISPFQHDENDFSFINNLTLADPSFLRDSDIDIILGASEYAQAIKSGLIKSDKNLIAQNSEFGWMVSGAIGNRSSNYNLVTLVTNVEITEKLDKFFNYDEFNNDDSEILTEEEMMCEEHFSRTHRRDKNGRYVVAMPFKNSIEEPELGDSRKIAMASLFSMERRFKANPKLKSMYCDFINEYISNGHMHKVTSRHSRAHYMPHHCVFKDSTTTKLRVVFNASQKTSNGKSLNDQLALGPMDQNDLASILLRWRKHQIAFTADIAQMYRQIRIDDSQTHLQRILWRANTEDPIEEYELTTVTYGTANAPYMAIRTLKQLSIDCEADHPIASEILRKDFYVDDVLNGADNVNDAILRYRELETVMNSACLNLRKWSSNSNELLKQIPVEKQELTKNNGIIKALGVAWAPENDLLAFDFSINSLSLPKTKRELTSEIASLYDPLGWLSPLVLASKHILQSLWSHKIDWDERAPDNFIDSWMKIKSEMNHITELRIPRWIGYSSNDPMELHGFSDASELGFAAALYVKNIRTKSVHLLVAKARVAPIRETKNHDNVTIPRLELCGALLLAQLTKKTLKALEIEFKRVCLWCDSKIVLDWIHANPKRYKSFIASRISKINQLVDKNAWSHVRSEDNAADCASRGLLPSELVSHPLWWHGPKFLSDESLEPPRYVPIEKIHVECSFSKSLPQKNTIIWPDVSSCKYPFTSLKRVFGYCLRFANNCKHGPKYTGPLSNAELKNAEMAIIKIVQSERYGDEINALRKNKRVKNSSKILCLSPFLDENEILRVGGRLKRADVPFDAKHQILMPNKHEIATLLIKNVHKECLHGGAKLVETVLRQNYWIPQGQRTIKSVLKNCADCVRVNPKPMTQYMGDLPCARITANQKPFSNTAVDYTGAILVKMSNGRGYKTNKAYVAIFVCMATKAMHIEAVTDLTAEAFLAAYQRLVARRGIVRNLYSDNGTNFVRSNKILLENLNSLDKNYDSDICHELSRCGTAWHFSPAGAPHFNGLAEAAVKSVKLHLKKTIADSKLTFEELSTLLAQIEACVNSRPLCSLSADPNDLSVITPAHFLVGESLIAPPEPCHLEAKASWLTKWQKVQQMSQYFWKRWTADYLNQLQIRSKWTKIGESPNLNDLVLIRDENLPPTQWSFGRITALYPGSDGLTRVVGVRTKTGEFKRPITKICAFPENGTNFANDTLDKITENVENGKKPAKPTNLGVNLCRVVAPKRKPLGVLPIVAALLAIFVSVSQQNPMVHKPYEITKFTSSPGLYFEKAHDVYMTHSNWNVLSYLNLQTLNNEFQSLTTNWTTAREFCYRKALLDGGCRNIIAHLTERLSVLEERNTLIFSNPRTKRSIPTLHFVGDIFGDIFGTLGSKFEQQYENDLSKLVKNDEHLMLLMKNHTSILESTWNLVKNDEANLQKQIRHFNALAESFKNQTNVIENEEKLHNYFIYLTQVINEYDRQQAAIIEVISDSKREFISHELFTASQIERQVELITQQVGTEYRVPTGIEVYSVSKISVYRIRNQYVFRIQIPLLKSQKHKLFKISRIPMIHGNDFLWINNNHNFLLTSVDRKLYQFLDSISNCIPYRNKLDLICHKPIHWFTANKANCVWDIFNHNSKSKCDFMREPAHTFVLGMDNNRFIFVMKEPAKVTIICKDIAHHDWLRGEGLIALEPNCYLTGDSVHLNTRIEFQNDSEIVIPNLNTLKDWVLASSNSSLNLTAIVLDGVQDIDELQKTLNETKKNLNIFKLSHAFNYHDISHYSMSIISLVTIMFYLLVKIGFLKACFRTNNIVLPTIDLPFDNKSIAGPENVGETNIN